MEKVYRSYYTKSGPIVTYMVQKLSAENGMRVLEPCAGDGIFVAALNSITQNLSMDVYELNPQAVLLLRRRYGRNAEVRITQADTLTDETLSFLARMGGIYDRVIANPPYGGWLDYEKRKLLSKLYPNLYVKETYTLFLYLCVQLLRDKGILVFIVPDTFLNLHRHTSLRRYLLTTTKIREVCLFPSCFFPGVNFGYSNLCVITLEKCISEKRCLDNVFKVVTGLRSVGELALLAKGPTSQHSVFNFKQREVYENIGHALFISEDPRTTHVINRCTVRIGDIAHCVTGFYSGNDKKYLRTASRHLKNARKYELVDTSLICVDYESKQDILDGIKGTKRFIPIVKGGGIKYFKPDMWYMDWGLEAVNDYKTNKKARFQNPQFYFQYGIGVPMVSSSRITASIIENRLFDQSIVGVFPKDTKWTYYLLALFNSTTCNTIIRTINPSANNPANYIKKIPFIAPAGRQLEHINGMVREIIEDARAGKRYPRQYEAGLGRLIAGLYGF